MKKTLTILGKCLMLLILVSSCQDDDKTFGNLDAPTNLTANYEIVGQSAEFPNGDGSGNVILKAHADNTISYKYIFPDQSTATVTSGEYTKRFTTNGVNSYEVTVIAYGKGGVASSLTFTVEDVLSNFEDPATVELLTGGSSKVWYWAAATAGHLGVGPNDGSENNGWPSYYSAAPFEKAGSEDSSCIYEDVLTFTKDGEIVKYTLDNGGSTFFNASYNSVGGEDSGSDLCQPFDTSGEKIAVLGPAESASPQYPTTGTQMTFSDDGFMGYYVGANTYEIIEITENIMRVRVVMGNDPGLAWYHIFTTQPPYSDDEPVYDNLVFSDEFDVDGAPDSSIWNMEIGNGVDGWGNNEAQYYRAENAIVQDGKLIITAKQENFSGFNYTSARMNTHNNFDFTYGKVEIRAKLPTGGGTWPALWMLGSNYQTVEWPACGEIDNMEHVGNDQNTIHGTLHYPGNSGGNGNTSSTVVEGVSDEFHIYTVNWSPNFIRFYVDDVEFKTFANSSEVPYNWDFFLIFNVAMGGSFGGNIDPAFTESSMEVDYVRVYQE